MYRITAIVSDSSSPSNLPLNVRNWLREINDHLPVIARASCRSAFRKLRGLICVARETIGARHIVRSEMRYDVGWCDIAKLNNRV